MFKQKDISKFQILEAYSELCLTAKMKLFVGAPC